MSDKKINEEQLKKVSGGEVIEDLDVYRYMYNIEVTREQLVNGEEYLFYFSRRDWILGTLVNNGPSSDKELIWWYEIHAKDGNIYGEKLGTSPHNTIQYELHGYLIYRKFD